ncbi:MAG: hypothetical protein U1E96_08690 [Azonexus sp.]
MPSSPLRIGPRIQETTTTTGIGPLTLDGATDLHFPFAVINDGEEIAVTVPYLIKWAGGVEWGFGELDAAGTTLTRSIVSGVFPGAWRHGGAGGQATLPPGPKEVSLAYFDLMSLAATGANFGIDSSIGDSAPACGAAGCTAGGIGARALGTNAAAYGLGATASGAFATALGAYAAAQHDFARVIGAGVSIGPGSLTVGLTSEYFGEQAASGQAVSGTPFEADLCSVFQDPDMLWWIDLTAVGANVARTQFRAIRRSILVRGTTLQIQGGDTVLVSTLGTVPAITCTLGATPDDNGYLPLHVSASSSGATAVDWRLFATLRGG